jgi:hypothetical protein
VSDMIRKAVELADGRWEVSDLTGMVFTPPFFNVSQPLDTLEQWQLDALAAQLERQYLDDLVMPKYIVYFTEMRRQPMGTDLTMWRIEYVVDNY